MEKEEHRFNQLVKEYVIAPTLLLAFTIGSYMTYIASESTKPNKHPQRINALEKETNHNLSLDSNSSPAFSSYQKK